MGGPAGWLRRAARLGALSLAAAALLLAGSPPSHTSAAPSGAWVYLRDGRPLVGSEHPVELLAVGDVMTGRGLEGTPDLFAQVAQGLRTPDLTIGNLEGAITASPPAEAGLPLLMPPGSEAELAQAGFDLLGLANNHSLDAGPAGLAETRRRLSDAGVGALDGQTAVVRQVGELKLAFLAWNDVGSPDAAGLLAAVKEARAQADGVLVLVHWGQEYARHPNLPQRQLADALLTAGADVVIGAHPHVVQDLSLVPPDAASDRTRLVAYSLGNFAFDQGWDDTGQGLALRLMFDPQGLRAAQALPVWTAPRPGWMDAIDATDLLARVLPPERIGFACSADTCWEVTVPDDPRSGAFTSGAIDLTGDGVPETVRLQGGAVEVVQEGRVAWRSPTAWHVRDAALGDPNGDGRYEFLLAVDDAKAIGASQPFVMGFRGGTYRQLWGGSPVSDPILEVALADLDGDGGQEMAVIESAPGGSGTDVAVWRWHGWGFSLVWRSPTDAYHDLVVIPPEGGQPARLSAAVR